MRLAPTTLTGVFAMSRLPVLSIARTKLKMPKKQIRDSGYYEERLKNEFPLVYADLKAGKHKTITEASIAAGIKTGRTRLHEL